MIDDFKQIPPRRPARLDTLQNGQSDGDISAPPYQAPSSDNIFTPSSVTPPPSIQNPSAQDFNTLPEPIEPLPESNDTSKKNKRFGFFGRFKKPSRKKAIIGGIIALALIGGGTAYALTRPEPPVAPKKPAAVAPTPEPEPIISPLTGIEVTEEQRARPVTGVMIENSPSARPQSGLKDAGVVFEAIAEYGVTRFLALFQETEPANIGPIRSLRPYYMDWAIPFDASIAHVGGSPDALARVKELGSKDLDQFQNAGAFRRINTRYAPHNMYSTMVQLVDAGKSRGYEKSEFTGFERKKNPEPAAVPPAKNINLAISGPTYNVTYNYDPATNAYKRVMGGAAHIDQESGGQLEPKVVIALAMPYSVAPNGVHSQYVTTGSGSAHFFQDGKVIVGTWEKADYKSQFSFKDETGKPIKLNPGQTWITVVSDPTKVTFGP